MSKKKQKAVRVELIPRDHPAYRTLEHLILVHHPHLAEASIALVWAKSWRPDPDGRVTLGKARKGSELERELGPSSDLAILLHPMVYGEEFTEAQRAAVLDHELCHFALVLDKNGDPKLDERDRKVYRYRRHDLEEFRAVVDRHGVWRADLEDFARTLLARAQPSLFDPPAEEAPEAPRHKAREAT